MGRRADTDKRWEDEKKKGKMKEDVSEIGIQRLASNWIARHSSYPMRIYYSNQMFWESFLFANADTSTIANPFFSNLIPPPVSSSSVPVDLMNGKRSRKWNSGVPSQRSSWYINIRSDVTRGINILQMCIIRSKKKKKCNGRNIITYILSRAISY